MSEPADPPHPYGPPRGERTLRVTTDHHDTEATPAYPEGEDADVPDPVVQPVGPVRTFKASSTELAASSRRLLRRQRDRRAERRAIQVLVGLFVGVGGLALVAVNVLIDDPRPAAVESAATTAPSTASPAATTRSPRDDVISAPFVETVDLPALRQLESEGLTIVAEGLPEVTADQRGPHLQALAARETCRFAYGVWEFSPNKRFRFLPTCPSLDGQVLFGAYAVEGGAVRMSPLRVSGVELVTEFQVEKPSRLRTRVRLDDGRARLSVRQRVTVIRGGLFGEAFFDTYAPRNTLSIPGRSARRRPAGEPAAASPKQDPLLELLRGEGRR